MRKGELPRPEGSRHPTSAEVLRCWLINNKLSCIVRPDAWGEVGTWGILLADVVRHIGDAVEKSKGIPAEATVLRIYDILMREMKKPTSKRTECVIEGEGEPVITEPPASEPEPDSGN